MQLIGKYILYIYIHIGIKLFFDSGNHIYIYIIYTATLLIQYGFVPAAQFAYRKGMGCTNALLTISHPQKSFDTGM